MVERDHRNQYAYRNHGTGHRIAQSDQAIEPRLHPLARGPRHIGEHECYRHRNQGRDGGNAKTVHREPDKTCTKLNIAIGECELEQNERGNGEADCDWQHAKQRREPRFHARKLRSGVTLARTLVETRAPSRPMFEQHHDDDKAHQNHRQFACGETVPLGEPGVENAGGKSSNAEIRNGAVIGQRFHQRQRDASGNGRPRQW